MTERGHELPGKGVQMRERGEQCLKQGAVLRAAHPRLQSSNTEIELRSLFVDYVYKGKHKAYTLTVP
jgi:hypothetical protein